MSDIPLLPLGIDAFAKNCAPFCHFSLHFLLSQVHMRVHSGVSYSETKLFWCPLCYKCYHLRETMELHKTTTHPNFDEEVDELSKF